MYIKQEIKAQIILRTRKEYYRLTTSFKCAIEGFINCDDACEWCSA